MGIAIFIVMFGGFFAMVVFAVVMLFRVLFAGSLTSLRTKARSLNATVVGKREKDVMRKSGVYTNYFVTFELNKGDCLEFSVSKSFYKMDNLGATGVLSYKGESFVDFKEGAALTPPEEKQTYILNGQVVEK